jgi:hypothetical protein
MRQRCRDPGLVKKDTLKLPVYLSNIQYVEKFQIRCLKGMVYIVYLKSNCLHSESFLG